MDNYTDSSTKKMCINLCLLIPAACVLDIPLPMLLAVKSLIFYFPSAWTFCVIDQIYICVLKYDLILVLYFGTYLFFFRQCLIFPCYAWCTSFFITDDIIPAIIRTDLYHFLADIQSIGCYDNRKSQKTLFYLFCQSDKCLAFTILFYFFFTLIDILLRIFNSCMLEIPPIHL